MSEENTPLVASSSPMNAHISRKDTVSKYCIATGIILFVSLVGSVLVRLPFNMFTLHPLLMSLFIVFITEGIVLLQPTRTPQEKKKGLKLHAMIQTVAYIASIFGFIYIFRNKVLSNKAHFESAHGKMGLFVFISLFIQLLFGITIGYVPQLFGSVTKAKKLWKYHRIMGYVLITLIWTTAQLGVRAEYMYNNLYSPHLIWLHWVAVILIFGGIISRTRVNKWKSPSIQ
ncbi:eukaryotic cytochrome b561-domain-containing protein [Pilobolus umbonatus]|nr:eukaryotic cytochrome b561-domain-containing protein [Pilobolus umbonatus]